MVLLQLTIMEKKELAKKKKVQLFVNIKLEGHDVRALIDTDIS